MRAIWNSVAVLFLGALLSACATDRQFGSASSIELADVSELPAPEVLFEHKIGRQEILDVKVVHSELLSGSFLTDGSGRINFPLAGSIQLLGMSPGEAEGTIEDRLRGRFVLNPQVTVLPKVIKTQNFSVGGQVLKPGSFSYDGNMTLLRSINEAGGRAEFAKLDEVLIFREVAGQEYIGVYNLQAIEKGNYADPKIYPNDVVMVGDNPGRRRLEAILQFIPVLTSTLVLIDRVNN